MTLTQVTYSYLRAEGETYRFGPLDAPILVLNATDADGVQWWSDEPDGWQAPEAVTPVDTRESGDGGYAGPTSFAVRTLSFGSDQTGVVTAPDRRAAQRAAARLLSVLQSRDPVLYVQPGPDGDQALWLRASGLPKLRYLRPEVFEWAAVMVADDPLRFDPRGTSESAGLPMATGGYHWPVIGNKVYGIGSAESGTLTLTNAGDENSPAVYTLTGPLTSPTALNATTGAWFTLTRTLGPTETAVVDTRAGTAQVNGVSVFGDLRGGFPVIVPGDNRIQWSHAGAANTLATLTVATTSTWK